MEYVQLEGIHIHEDGYAKFIELTLFMAIPTSFEVGIFAAKVEHRGRTPNRTPKRLIER